MTRRPPQATRRATAASHGAEAQPTNVAIARPTIPPALAAAFALPEIVGMNLATLHPGQWHAEHAHDHHEIHFVRSGRGTLRAGTRCVEIGPGSMYLFLPGEVHGGFSLSGTASEILCIGVRFPTDAAVARDRSPLPFFLTGAVAQAVAPGLRTLAELLAAEPAGTGPRSAPLPRAALGPLLQVLAAMVEPVRVLAAGSRRQRALAEQALRQLVCGAGRPPTLCELAARLSVTSGHLGAALGAITGQTYPALASAERVRAARALLAQDELPVREVASRVGLSGERALARLMRRVTGKAPTDVR